MQKVLRKQCSKRKKYRKSNDQKRAALIGICPEAPVIRATQSPPPACQKITAINAQTKAERKNVPGFGKKDLNICTPANFLSF
ncbi:hypothetical protein ECA727_05678 [Escherichia coli ECA-727]|nr:hypothetical protein ECA727_05678 [Escherichia coli ECA-727]